MSRAAIPSLRPAVEADLPFLLELRLATMTPHFARQGLEVSADEHRRRAEFRLDAATIIEVDGHPVGVIKLLQDTRTWTIEQIQIAPAHQGRGLGTTVLRAVIAEARHANALLHLSVLKRNPAAGLYARLGFRTLAESVHSYKMTFIETEAPPEV
jgi:ribosomal protein S18 acetylase RimI-like enzyme